MKKTVSVFLSLGCLIAFAGIAKAGFQTAFQEGEHLVFRIRWGAITGGYSTLSVPAIEQVAGQPAYHIVSEARSAGIVDTFYHVEDKNESWLDAFWPRSLRYEKNIKEGQYRVHEVVDYNHATRRYKLQETRFDKNTRESKEGDIPPNVLDVFSSLYYVRTLPLEVGKSFTIDVHSGDKTWPLVVKVIQREKVKVKAGKFDCFRVEPVLREAGIFISKGKKLEVWLTADDRHMPVLMRSEVFIGHISAELVKHKSPPPKDETQKLAAQPVLAPTQF
jgi:hypothetical protein